MYCSLRSSTSSCLILRYLYWFQCVMRSRIVRNYSSSNFFNNSLRIGFVRLLWFNSHSSIIKSNSSIREKSERKDCWTRGDAEARASSRENTSFFVRKWVVPSADSDASLNMGYSINWSRESTGESSQVLCFECSSRPCCFPFKPSEFLPQRR